MVPGWDRGPRSTVSAGALSDGGGAPQPTATREASAARQVTASIRLLIVGWEQRDFTLGSLPQCPNASPSMGRVADSAAEAAPGPAFRLLCWSGCTVDLVFDYSGLGCEARRPAPLDGRGAIRTPCGLAGGEGRPGGLQTPGSGGGSDRFRLDSRNRK